MTKRYFITSIVPGAEVCTDFVKSIRTYCNKNNAKLLLVPTPFSVSKKDFIDDAIESQDNFVTKDLRLNSKIRISTIPVKPEAVNPLTGLTRQSQTDGSFIFGSPKQFLKIVPNSNIKLPHAIMTPGCITLPHYKDTRTGRIAAEDHVIGGIIVEVVSDLEYHFRQVQASKDGSFIDLCIRYSEKGTEKVEPEALILGDWHSGATCPTVRETTYKMLDLFKPSKLILHDVMNGHSVPHHDKEKLVTRGMQAEMNLNSIDDELKLLYDDMKIFSKKAKSTWVVKSNHDEWLEKYINSGEYVTLKDYANHKICVKLAAIMHEGKDILEYGIKSHGPLNNVFFLERDEDLKLTPQKVQCGAHGDLGGNGSRGSLVSIETAYSNGFFGHSHTPGIIRKAWQVGTSTFLKLSYNRGPSSWLNTHGILYKDGTRQLINIIEGKYRG